MDNNGRNLSDLANNTEFSLELAEVLYQSNDLFPIDLDVAWQWLGFTRKENCLELLKNNFVVTEDFHQTVLNSSQQGGRPSHKYYLTLECFKSMGMMAGTEKGKRVRKYFLQCEQMLYRKTNPPTAKSQIDLVMDLSERVSKLAGLSPAIVAQLSLQAALTIQPQLVPALQPTMQALINSTATDHNLLTAKQLGDRLGISAQKVNKLLIEQGYQYKNEEKSSSKEADYLATELGKNHSQVTQSAKGGHTFQQLRWLESMVDLLAQIA